MIKRKVANFAVTFREFSLCFSCFFFVDGQPRYVLITAACSLSLLHAPYHFNGRTDSAFLLPLLTSHAVGFDLPFKPTQSFYFPSTPAAK